MIKRVTSNKWIENMLEEALSAREEVLIDTLFFIGLECVNHARLVPASEGFTDQTGNLRSSIGCAVIRNGQVVRSSGFDVVKNGKEGQTEGKTFITKFSSSVKGISLYVVAGMDYAFELEAKRHRDVLTSSELLAEKRLPEMLRQLGFKA